MIPQKNVQEILESAKVEDVVGEFVNLKKRGVNMIGLCPFHNEKTPSFTVSPAKNIYKCFGCGQAGGPVQFLMEHENLSFPDSLRYLAKKYGIQIEEIERTPEAIKEQQEMESLYIINEYAQRYYDQNLFETDEGKSVGLSYFKNRGFREETIKKFGLGFATKQKNGFTSKAVTEGYNIDLLKKLGLTSKYDNDFFRDRVMFTIHNMTGKVIAFAGRILQKNVKAPKYINSPETDIYFKSKVLYGAYFAKTAIRKNDECILVEGYTDVISLHQSGVENVVASSGTSLTVEQIRLIKRFTPNIKILYDGDAAGIKAALRGLDLVLEQDLNVRVVLLPDGEDPDSYLQKVGVTVFKEFIDRESQDFILFKTNLLLAESKNNPVKRAGVVKDIVESIAKIPDPIKRSLYIKECARIVEVEESVLIAATNKVVGGNIKKRREDRERKHRQKNFGAPQSSDSFPTQEPQLAEKYIGPTKKEDYIPTDEYQEKDIVRLLINYGGQIMDKDENITVAEYLLGNIQETIDDFDSRLYAEVAKECLSIVLKGNKLTKEYFVNHQDRRFSQLAVNLISQKDELSPGWAEREVHLQTQKMPDENFGNDALYSMLKFKQRKLKKTIGLNLERIKHATDGQEIERLLKVHKKLSEIKKELGGETGTVVY